MNDETHQSIQPATESDTVRVHLYELP
eukprot:COSAG02_NODE_26700_length_626_cov_48.252372_2_plen_26_part_01